jgi:lipoprotein NlpD
MSYRIFFAVLSAFFLWGCTGSHGVYHVVGEGQTLYRIGQAYHVDQNHLARINRIGDPTRLRIGERLFIPGATKIQSVPAAVFPSSISAEEANSSPKKVPSNSVSDLRGQKSKTSKSHSNNVAAAPSTKSPTGNTIQTVKFSWPARGTIVRRFGESEGELCQGLQLSLSSGSPVLSAAAGRVTFSGDQINGYGNLFILKHDNTFFTVYGINEKNLVEVGSHVRKGEKIALSIKRLHFEIRRGKAPVNPLFYLP